MKEVNNVFGVGAIVDRTRGGSGRASNWGGAEPLRGSDGS